MGVISRVALKISLFFDYIARWTWMALMLVVVGNIIMRMFGRPIRGTFEYVEFLTALAIGLSLAYCAVKEGHISASFLVEKFNEKIQTILQILIDLLVMSFLGFAFWRLNAYAINLRLTNQVAQTTEIHHYYFVHIIALGFLVYALVSLGSLIDNTKKVLRK